MTKRKKGNSAGDFVIIPIYCNGRNMRVRVKKRLAEVQSTFQNMLFFDTPRFGKCLLINGIMQCSDFDHDLYDNEILRNLNANDRNILILGGGDGFVAEMALKLNSKLSVGIIDLDIEVVNGSKKYLDQKVFSDKRVKLLIRDALDYLRSLIKEKKNKLDGIVFDLTDEPVRESDIDAKKGFVEFYSELIDLSYRSLKNGDWVSMQAGASRVIPKYNNAVKALEKLLRKKFHRVERTDIMIPSFGEKNAFLFGEK